MGESAAPDARCLIDGERLRQVAEQGHRTAAAVNRMGLRLDVVEKRQALQDERISGLRASIDGNTKALDRVAESLEHLDERLDRYADRFAAHEVSAERERGTVSRVALSAWLVSIGFGLSLAGLIASVVWPGVADWLREQATQILARGGAQP